MRKAAAPAKAGAPIAAAEGRYAHVYVERASGRSMPIPEGHRRLMESLRIDETP